MELVRQLNQHGLQFLADILEVSSEYDREHVIELIKNKTGIDLNQPNLHLCDLSDEQMEELKFFEQDGRRDILRSISLTNEKNIDEVEEKNDDLTRQIEMDNNTRFTTFVMRYSWAMMILIFTFIFIITLVVIPEQNVRYVDTILGFLMANGLGVMVNFIYGSSFPGIGINRKRKKDDDDCECR